MKNRYYELAKEYGIIKEEEPCFGTMDASGYLYEYERNKQQANKDAMFDLLCKLQIDLDDSIREKVDIYSQLRRVRDEIEYLQHEVSTLEKLVDAVKNDKGEEAKTK